MKKIFLVLITLVIGNLLSYTVVFGTVPNLLSNDVIKLESTWYLQSKDTAEPFWVKTTSSVRLFRDMGNLSSVILYIPSGETVEVFEEIDDYYSASYQGEKGYILEKKVKPLNFSEPSENAQNAKTPDPKKMNEKDRFAFLTSKYDSKTANALYQHKIWKGMSTKMAEDSWGPPLTIDRYIGNGEKYEEWNYSTYVLVFFQGNLSEWKMK